MLFHQLPLPVMRKYQITIPPIVVQLVMHKFRCKLCRNWKIRRCWLLVGHCFLSVGDLVTSVCQMHPTALIENRPFAEIEMSQYSGANNGITVGVHLAPYWICIRKCVEAAFFAFLKLSLIQGLLLFMIQVYVVTTANEWASLLWHTDIQFS